MRGRRNGRIFECVAIDLNTQNDFCDAMGARPVANLFGLIAQLRRTIAWTKRNQVPVVSSIDSHRSCELAGDAQRQCCVDGSAGQQKIGFTIFAQCANIEVDNTLSIPLNLFNEYQQVIFRKRSDDLLSNPKADRFLTQLPVTEYIVFGTTIECSVKALTLGLLSRNQRVAVIVDACGYWNKGRADLSLRQMDAKGATLLTVDDLCVRKLSRDYRYPIRPMAGSSGNGNGRNGRHQPARNRTGSAHANGNERLPHAADNGRIAGSESDNGK